MESVGAAKFKEQCLAILDHLPPDGMIITKRGKPVARVVPITSSPLEMFESLGDRIEIRGDIMSTGEAWKANG